MLVLKMKFIYFLQIAPYGFRGFNFPLVYLLILVLYKLFVCLLNFLTYFLHYLDTSLHIRWLEEATRLGFSFSCLFCVVAHFVMDACFLLLC